MAKNIFLGIYTLIFGLALIALASGRLAWVSTEELRNNSPEEILQKAIEMHKPEVLEMGKVEILHVPTSKISGRNWSVNHAFYIFEDGTLKRIGFNAK